MFTKEKFHTYLGKVEMNSKKAQHWLVRKVITIAEVNGLLRTVEVVAMLKSNFMKISGIWVVTFMRAKPKGPKRLSSFVIFCPKQVALLNEYFALEKIVSLRESDRIFHRLDSNQPIGKNEIAKILWQVAEYIFDHFRINPENFTGHCWRRTGATWLANSGASIVTLETARGWLSSSIADVALPKGETKNTS